LQQFKQSVSKFSSPVQRIENAHRSWKELGTLKDAVRGIEFMEKKSDAMFFSR
jgi:hypothetical protein